MSRQFAGILFVIAACGCHSQQHVRYAPEPAAPVAFPSLAEVESSDVAEESAVRTSQKFTSRWKDEEATTIRPVSAVSVKDRAKRNPSAEEFERLPKPDQVSTSETNSRRVAFGRSKKRLKKSRKPASTQAKVATFEFQASEPLTLEIDSSDDNDKETTSSIQQVAHAREFSADLIPDSLDEIPPPPAHENKTSAVPARISQRESPQPMPPMMNMADDVESNSEKYPIDLPTALRLAGADNWSVKLAAEQVQEASARLAEAKSMWLPSLNLAVSWTKHDGPLQATDGSIQDISRNSLFVGGGAVVQNAPLAGGAGGPSRMQVDLSLADAIFQPLAAMQSAKLAHSTHNRVFNDTQLATALAYLDLIAAQERVQISQDNFDEATALSGMTEAFVTGGKAARGEVQRVQVVIADRERQQIQAQLDRKLASTELARILQLDEMDTSAGSILHSIDNQVAPLNLVEAKQLEALIAQGQTNRPEASEQTARVDVSGANVRREKWRPWLPHVNVGVSGGTFGGGTGSTFDNDSGRSDIDALLVWQLRNLGAGNRAMQRSSRSRYEQELIKAYRVRDVIAAEVKAAYFTTQAQRRQMDVAQKRLETASDVFERNITRIRAMEGLPIEAIQALNALADARFDLLNAVINYNKSQFSLLYAIGTPLQSP